MCNYMNVLQGRLKMQTLNKKVCLKLVAIFYYYYYSFALGLLVIDVIFFFATFRKIIIYLWCFCYLFILEAFFLFFSSVICSLCTFSSNVILAARAVLCKKKKKIMKFNIPFQIKLYCFIIIALSWLKID